MKNNPPRSPLKPRGDVKKADGSIFDGDTPPRSPLKLRGDVKKADGSIFDGDTPPRSPLKLRGDVKKADGSIFDGDTPPRSPLKLRGDVKKADGSIFDGDAPPRSPLKLRGDVRGVICGIVLCILFFAAALPAGAADLPDTVTLTQLGREYYLRGEAEKDKARKKDWLDKALAETGRALKADPGNTGALYWRSMSLLQMADVTGGLGALKMVKEALRGLQTVSEKEPAYDSAGAYRSWGKVLIDAPGWTFIGDRKKGLDLLKKAKDIAPGSLVNRLYLAEACIKNGKPDEARGEINHILSAPPGNNPRDDNEVRAEAGKLLKELR